VHGYSLLRTQLHNDYFHDIFNEAEKFDVNIEAHRKSIINYHSHFLGLHVLISSIDTETGPGVFETALAYTTASRVADNALLFKYLVKSLGMKYGITPSFMAKPWGNVRLSFPVAVTTSYATMAIWSAAWV
jgi:glutamine synthetase